MSGQPRSPRQRANAIGRRTDGTLPAFDIGAAWVAGGVPLIGSRSRRSAPAPRRLLVRSQEAQPREKARRYRAGSSRRGASLARAERAQEARVPNSGRFAPDCGPRTGYAASAP